MPGPDHVSPASSLPSSGGLATSVSQRDVPSTEQRSAPIDVDQLLAKLSANKARWARLPVTAKAACLKQVRDALVSVAEQWVALSVRAKGTRTVAALAGEEWMSGPWALLRAVKQLIRTLESIGSSDDFRPALPLRRTASGQRALHVFPLAPLDRLLFNGLEAEVWLQPGARTAFAAAPNDDGPGSVCLVLGAGNVSSIAPLDALYKLCNDNSVVLLKLNPVTDYLLPLLETIFAPLIADGYLAIVAGGADLGALLCDHPLIDAIHMTGSADTHDRIVFGQAGNRHGRQRVNHKPITSELGGVSPVIVVPGPWTVADIRFQAANIATQRLHNCGFNCIASQIAVLPDHWPRSDALIAAIRDVMRSAPPRPLYYPGARERIDMFSQRYQSACGTESGADPHDILIAEVHADSNDQREMIFVEEAFAPVLGITRISGSNPIEYLEHAIDFCNQRLAGTLGASLLIHPATMREMGDRFDALLARLRYGCIGVNIWQGAGFLLTETPWGAYPGHTVDSVQSGIGKVHNTLMLENVQKTVVRGPFHAFPRSLMHGEGWLPLPPWFVTHRSAHVAGRLLFEHEANPSLLNLPRIAWHVYQWR